MWKAEEPEVQAFNNGGSSSDDDVFTRKREDVELVFERKFADICEQIDGIVEDLVPTDVLHDTGEPRQTGYRSSLPGLAMPQYQTVMTRAKTWREDQHTSKDYDESSVMHSRRLKRAERLSKTAQKAEDAELSQISGDSQEGSAANPNGAQDAGEAHRDGEKAHQIQDKVREIQINVLGVSNVDEDDDSGGGDEDAGAKGMKMLI